MMRFRHVISRVAAHMRTGEDLTMIRSLFTISLAVVVLVLAGCASTAPGPAGMLKEGNPGQAAKLARDAIAADDTDASAWRDLGIALYMLERPGDALDPLHRATGLRPRDRQALFFRARSLDALDRTAEAIGAYGSYLARARGRDAELARTRMEQLRRIRIRHEVAFAIAREESLTVAEIPENSVALADFANPAGSDTLAPVAKGLAVMTLTDLTNLPQIRVLERQRLNTLLDELALASPPAAHPPDTPSPVSEGALEPVASVLGIQQRLARLTDPESQSPFYEGNEDGIAGPMFHSAVRAFQRAKNLAVDGVPGPRTQAVLEEAWQSEAAKEQPTAIAGVLDPAYSPRLGLLLGARRIIQGSILPMGASDVQLGAEIYETVREAADPEASAVPVEGPMTKLLDLQKRLTFEIVGLLGIELTKAQRREMERPQTKDLDAFMAFCRGIDFEDRGLHDDALREYRVAMSMDPAFALAVTAASALALQPADMGAAEGREIGALPDPVPGADERAGETARKLDILPDMGAVTEIDTRTPETVRAAEMGTIVIEGDIPPGGQPR